MSVNFLVLPRNLLADEVERLRRELAYAHAELEAERCRTNELVDSLAAAEAQVSIIDRDDPADDGFDEDDELSAAFDQFINEPDPHLAKVRSFLLG